MGLGQPRPDRSQTTHVIFDAVGTLIRPAEPVAQTYHRIGARHGSRLTCEQVCERFPRAFDQFYRNRRHSSESVERDCWREIVNFVLHDVGDRQQCFEDLFVHFANGQSWQVFADVESCLDALLRCDFQLAVASNFDSRLHRICQENATLSRIGRRILSVEAGYKKPDSRFFEYLARTLGVKRCQLLMLGDDAQADIEGAINAGLQAVWLNRKSISRPPSIGSVPEIATLDELTTGWELDARIDSDE